MHAMKTRIALLPLALLAPSTAAHAQSAPPGSGVSLEWDLRARHEQVDDAAFVRDARADTLRARVGVRGKWTSGWQALLEGEGIVGFDNTYNSGANRQVAYPAVVDPSGVELNQAWIGWRNAKFGATVGRQRIQLDNQRFVGNVGWRQNEQTFDAASFDLTPAKDFTLRYAWLDRVHRVNGDDAIDPLARERNLSTHLLNAAWKHGAQQLVGYGYLHHDQDVASASSATWGLRWTGAVPAGKLKFGWALEAARQRDYARNPLRFRHDYWLAEPSVKFPAVAVKAGWEHLGGSGTHAFQTPLATLHAFNGWADKFLVTPASGLDDRYLGLSGNVGAERAGARIGWGIEYHDYQPAHGGGGRYGTELGAMVSLPIARGLAAMVKVADYRADHYARDTRKLWLQLEYKGSRAF